MQKHLHHNVTKKSSSAGEVSSVNAVIAAVVIPVALPSKVPATKVSEPTVHLSVAFVPYKCLISIDHLSQFQYHHSLKQSQLHWN